MVLGRSSDFGDGSRWLGGTSERHLPQVRVVEDPGAIVTGMRVRRSVHTAKTCVLKSGQSMSWLRHPT